MDSVDSLWKSNNITMDLSPEEGESGIVESLPFSLDTFGLSTDQDIVLETVQQSSAGVKRSHDENLNSSHIQQSKVVILSDVSEQQPVPVPVVTFNIPTATSSHPRLENDPGLYGFAVSFSQMEERGKNKSWEFSQLLNKLYVDMDRWVLVEFSAPAGFFIRALPVYSLPSDLTLPVRRCPSHAALQDKTNKDFPFPDHLIRVEGEDSVYQEDFNSADSPSSSPCWPWRREHRWTAGSSSSCVSAQIREASTGGRSSWSSPWRTSRGWWWAGRW